MEFLNPFLAMLMIGSIFYLVAFAVLFVLIFGIGYKVGNSRQATVGGPDNLESELKSLEAEAEKAQAAVATLVQATKTPPTPKRPKKPGQITKYPASSLQKLSSQLTSLTDDINGIILWVDKLPKLGNETSKSSQAPEIEPRRKTGESSDEEKVYADLFASGSSEPIEVMGIEEPPEPNSRVPSSGLKQSQSRRRTETDVMGLIGLYNRAVTDAFAREQFREQCRPLRIGTVNAEERTRNSSVDSEFRETPDGDYFAFPSSETNEYAVVPRLGVTIEAVSYSAGAFGEVFSNTRNYNPTLFYSRYQVIDPAIFKQDGDRWELQFPGELDLGTGD